MDRTLKERIIGAVVLVVFVVLVVPIFLDGPPDHSEIVTESVQLPGQSTQKMQTQVLERNRSTPVATSADASAEPKEEKPKPQILAMKTPEPRAAEPEPKVAGAAPAKKNDAKPEPEPEPEPEPDSEPATAAELAVETSSTGMWAVQLGSFSNQANAEKLAADLRKRGYAAFLSKLATQKGQLHRVRIGPQENRDAAATVAKKLESDGHKGQVVPHP